MVASNMFLRTLVTCSLALAPACAHAGSTPLFTSGDGVYHTYRIPAVARSGKGTLLAFAEGRESSSDHGNVDIVLRRSEDNGHTWGDMLVVRDAGSDQVGNPCPIVDRETGGILLLFCGSSNSEAEVLRGHGTRKVYLTTSDDDGKTWTAARDISSSVKPESWRWYATGPCSGIQIHEGRHRGRLVAPANHSVHFSDGRKWQYRCHSLYSDDHGKTWNVGSSSAAGASETQIAEAGPDLLVQDIRMQTHRKGLRATRTSKDGGETWSELAHDPQRPDPRCQGAIISTPAGLLSSNPSHPSERRGLTVYQSKDRGGNWSKLAALHNGPAAYSDLVRTTSGRIACLYECGTNDPYEMIVFHLFGEPQATVHPTPLR